MIKMKTLAERRQYYAALEQKRFTQDEIMHVMPEDELQMNAQKGGIAAIAELRKRNALANLKTTLDDKPLDLGC